MLSNKWEDTPYSAQRRIAISTNEDTERSLEKASASLQAVGAKKVRAIEGGVRLCVGSPIGFRLFGIYLADLPVTVDLSVAQDELLATFRVAKGAASIRSLRVKRQFELVVEELSRELGK